MQEKITFSKKMTKSPNSDPFFAFASLDNSELELARGAFLIAQSEYPELDIEASIRQLDEMAEAVRAQIQETTPPEQRVAALNQYLFAEKGFIGNSDNYYALGNNFLNVVLEKRTGIPITLAVVYIEVGRRAGLPLVGINFPGHFLVKYRLEHLEIFLDVFEGGTCMTDDLLQAKLEANFEGSVDLDPTMLAEATDKEILARILRNLTRTYTLLEQYDKAVTAAERITWLLPNAVGDYRMLGYLYYKTHAYSQSITAFETYLRLADIESDVEDIEQNIQNLQRLLARLN